MALRALIRSSILSATVVAACGAFAGIALGEGLPAFPGAEGYGAMTPGGRGGKVYVVTNLNDHGPGSLREAVEASGPRIVEFGLSGTIPLEKDLEITSPNITIAGQTAPGDGICLRNYKLGIATHDVVVRYLRIRRGDESHQQDDGIGVYENTKAPGDPWAENVMVDHCSVSWTCDEGINTWHHTKNVTIQWCIISEALHNAVHVGHGFAATIGGENTTYHHNLLANCPGRNPSIGGNNNHFKTINLDWRNNVLFNWQERTLDGKPWSINIINNYLKPGPSTKLKDRLVRIDKIRNDPQGHWYVAGNYYDGNPELSADNRKGVTGDDGVNPDDWLVKEPFQTAPVKTETAQAAYESVLANVGANLPKRDPVDTRIVNEVRTGKTTYGNGIVQSQKNVGGWPDLKSEPAAKDSDGDGIPDWWEKKYGLNPDDASDGAKDLNGDGYTNVEKYLDGIDPTRKVDWTKPENNVNHLTESKLTEGK
ncbi:MAG: pectate lyase family protein [Phycisphaerae bacterium]